MITSKRFARFIVVTLLCTAAISAQEPSAAPPPASASKIYLNVVVSPKSGPRVGDLQSNRTSRSSITSPRGPSPHFRYSPAATLRSRWSW
jgi:hypothetical protein